MERWLPAALLFFVIAYCFIYAHIPQSAAHRMRGNVVGEATHYKIRPGDTLSSVAQRFDLGIPEIRSANPGIHSLRPRSGTNIMIPAQHALPAGARKGIVINLAQRRLYYFSNQKPVMTFPIAIGREGWETPLGHTEVMLKRRNPVWTPPESIRRTDPSLPPSVPPGPDNPLGEYALSLGWPGILIHGTNNPQGIGKRSSHGCIRLYPQDIKALFAVVKEGTPVTVIDTHSSSYVASAAQ